MKFNQANRNTRTMTRASLPSLNESSARVAARLTDPTTDHLPSGRLKLQTSLHEVGSLARRPSAPGNVPFAVAPTVTVFLPAIKGLLIGLIGEELSTITIKLGPHGHFYALRQHSDERRKRSTRAETHSRKACVRRKA